MSVFTFTMKTHSRTDITKTVDGLNKCATCGNTPKIIKQVVGKAKDVFYRAECCNEENDKISRELDNVISAWNSHNPHFLTPNAKKLSKLQ